jgi:hypothetical protein
VKPSYSSCSMRPWRENDDDRRYDLADLTACAYQLTRTWLAAQRASEREKPSNSSCSTRPDLENADERRYDSALLRALRWPGVLAWLSSPARARDDDEGHCQELLHGVCFRFGVCQALM